MTREIKELEDANWPPMKKAIWVALMAEKLNDGHYIKAFDLCEKLYQAALKAGDNGEALEAVIENLKGLLCDPSGKCCISGSDEDRRLIDRCLFQLSRISALTSGRKEGWVLVPREPTQEMLDAATLHLGNDGPYPYLDGDSYAAMIAAAPKMED